MSEVISGHLNKMKTQLTEKGVVEYQLSLDEVVVPINDLLDKKIRLVYQGAIHCTHCGRQTKKSFNQGYCYPCFTKLAQCDACIVKPETCHYFEGSCREPEWAEQYCMQDHFVYLANSSGIKVGITRGNQIPTRWMDQGAIQALPIFRVKNRLQSGLLEVVFKNHVADKTNWRAMLKGQVDLLDLAAERDRLIELCGKEISQLQQQYGVQSIQLIADAEPVAIAYPVVEYPSKVSTFNLDKTPVVEGVLKGIKGQYLMLDTGVINIRKFTAYQVEFSA